MKNITEQILDSNVQESIKLMQIDSKAILVPLY